MYSRKVLIDYVPMCVRSGRSHAYFIPGFYAAQSQFTVGVPLVHFMAKVLPKGIIFPNGFAFTGSRGTGSHSQLKRGINPGPLY